MNWTQHTTTHTLHHAPTTHTEPQANTRREDTTEPYRYPAIKAVTFNMRGMHNTILYLKRIFNTPTKPASLIHLTETKTQSH
jgi:hypothetical protein